MKNKKGMLGLDTVKAVIIGLMVLAVLVVAVLAVLIPIRNSYEVVDTHTAYVNAEAATPSGAGVQLTYGTTSYRNGKCSAVKIVNGTYGLIAAGNYTVSSACVLSNSTQVCGDGCNGVWKVNYTATYNDPNAYNLVENMTNAPNNFFTNSGTFFTLLGVIVLILIIGIVIAAVTRFSPGTGTFSSGASEEGGSLENT